MKTSRLLLVSFLGLSSFAAFACGDSGSSGGDGDAGDGDGDNAGDGDNTGDGDGDDSGDGDGDDACEPGSEGCECYGNGTCDGSLSCLSDTCVDAGGDGDGDMGGATGDGDGDMGGATGDGDGDDPDVECSRSVECDDEDPCTQDACVDATCESTLIEGALCETGTCVARELGDRTEGVCAEALDGGDISLCAASTCDGTATVGCDIAYTFGTATARSAEGNDGSRTTVLSIPVTAVDFEDADLTIQNSNCLLTLSIPQDAPVMVELTFETEVAQMCGGEEVLFSRSVDFDLSTLEVDVADGEGTTTLCGPANAQFAPGGFYRESAEQAFEDSLRSALGDLDAVAAVGDVCGVCSGDCTGLSCQPASVD